MSFEPGEQLCAEGGEAPECYVIAEGEAAVTIGGRAVRTVGEDDVVGERGRSRGTQADGHRDGQGAHDHLGDLARAAARRW